MNNGKKVIRTIAIPLITLLVIYIICLINGIVLFETGLSWLTFVRAIANAILVTYALSINLNSGRFDFSIGSISLLSSVISSQLTIKYNLNPIIMLLLSVSLGLILGLISGGIYILVELPPIIVSLGVTLLYEGISYTLTGGHGITLISREDILGFGSIQNYLIIIFVALIFMIVVFNNTKFGYEYKALITGQKVSINTGINERKNALICYAIAGALMGAQGFVSSTNNGAVMMSLNFGSISPMFMAFLPMFIGGYIGNYSNDKVGYLLGAISSALLSLLYVRLNVSSSIQQITSALLLVGFLIYLNNKDKLINLIKESKRQSQL